MTENNLQFTHIIGKEKIIQNMFRDIKDKALELSKILSRNIEININTNLAKDVAKIKFSLNI